MPMTKEKMEGIGINREASVLGEGAWEILMMELHHVL